ncbi:MAG: PEP-utilizing enzyme [Thalassobaculales bacterium]
MTDGPDADHRRAVLRQRFGAATKAAVLAALGGVVTTARVLPQHALAVGDWRRDRAAALAAVHRQGWADRPLIVRSSAVGEDSAAASLAGRFLSVPNVTGAAALAAAVDRVIASFAERGEARDDNEVLIQPMLEGVVCAGVALTRDPGGNLPYFVISIEESGDTAAVTGGYGRHTTTHFHARAAAQAPSGRIAAVVALCREIEALTGCAAIDVEFAFTADALYLFQARPLRVAGGAIDEAAHGSLLHSVARHIEAASRPHPRLHGRRTIFGVMPDWNPAEIIGTRPRPLALSLYRELITDAIWAYQRSRYGYKNLRSFPLMKHFHGLPYIDARVSFNSFLPADIAPGLADRFVDHYLDCLAADPSLHDKVEFDIVFSCYTFDLPSRLESLAAAGFSAADRRSICDSLRRLTNRIINGENGLWKEELLRVDELEGRHREILDAAMDPVERIYWLMEDCKRYGTLPFAGLARAGFIAMEILQSLVKVGVLSEADRARFLRGLGTISSQMGQDLRDLDRGSFLRKYGHLRPGTYDILSLRYDEAPERYFPPGAAAPAPQPAAPAAPFALSLDQIRAIGRLLDAHGLAHDVIGLFDFIENGIRGREYAKFVFTRSLSDVLSLLAHLGASHGLTRDDMSYLDIAVLRDLHVGSAIRGDALRRAVEQGRAAHDLTRQILLPPVILSPEEAWSFAMPPTAPNFITQDKVVAPVRAAAAEGDLAGAIVAIASADPGYDWIFARGVAGFVTAYGGINSHMAIRAAELGVPAAIGAGESLFAAVSAAGMVELDCAGRQIRILA